MELLFFGRGLLFGFTIAASVGPIWLLCARRTLAEGRLIGLCSGLGVATADAFYGAVAALGLSLVTALLVAQHVGLRLVGGAFLCYLGLATLRTAPTERKLAPVTRRGLAGAYFSTLGLTLTNPLTIVSFLGIFAGLGLADAGGSPTAALLLVAGVFCGSAGWWLVLSSVLGRARGWLTPRVLRGVNVAAGLLIAGFGVVAVVGALVE